MTSSSKISSSNLWLSLKENNLEIAEKIIIRNIVLNYLSEYLYQEQDKIITLPKTPSSKRKMYKI